MKKVSIVGKMLVGTITLFGLTGVTITSAASWTVSQEKVSEKGRWSTYGKPNVKKSNSNYASFNGDALPNFYGYTTRLINSKAEGR